MNRLQPRIRPVLILCRLKKHHVEAEKKEQNTDSIVYGGCTQVISQENVYDFSHFIARVPLRISVCSSKVHAYMQLFHY